MFDIAACVPYGTNLAIVRILATVSGGCTFVASVFMIVLLAFFHKRRSPRELEDLNP
jgi:hypothetical protein